jgi:hypothetical protein
MISGPSFLKVMRSRNCQRSDSQRFTAVVKLPLKAVITRYFFAPLRATDMDTETTSVENTLPEQETPKKQVGRH